MQNCAVRIVRLPFRLIFESHDGTAYVPIPERSVGVIFTTPGNLRLRETAWWGWEMSHVWLDQILTQGAGRNGRFEA